MNCFQYKLSPCQDAEITFVSEIIKYEWTVLVDGEEQFIFSVGQPKSIVFLDVQLHHLIDLNHVSLETYIFNENFSITDI